jgi:CubicO group peptidase (beta-lactamase class C family)
MLGSAALAGATTVLTAGTPALAAQDTVVSAPATPGADRPISTTRPGSQEAIGLIPDTAAGRLLAEWLVALNSGSLDLLRRFHAANVPAEDVEWRTALDLRLRHQWGTLQFHSAVTSAEHELTALLYATLSEQWSNLTVTVEPFMIRGLPASPPPDLADVALDDAELPEALDRYLDRLSDADVFSGAVLVARGGTTIHATALGLADVERTIPNAVTTRFNLGSMNKMFTAVSVAQLVEAGAFDVDTTMASLLPDFPNQEIASQITVHHLLTHTSGLGDIFVPAFFEDRDRYRDPADYFPLFADQPLQFAPGEEFSYSNAGFIVLGAIVEQVSGISYFEYVRQHIYTPAGMIGSDTFERDAAVTNLAIGYTYPTTGKLEDLTPDIVLGPRVPNTSTLGFQGSPAGGGYSTVEDLARFHEALWSFSLIGEEMTQRVTTGVVAAPFGPDAAYGYGFIEAASGDQRVVGHGGGAPGISARLDMYPESGLVVAVLSNYDMIADVVADRIRRMVTA